MRTLRLRELEPGDPSLFLFCSCLEAANVKASRWGGSHTQTSRPPAPRKLLREGQLVVRTGGMTLGSRLIWGPQKQMLEQGFRSKSFISEVSLGNTGRGENKMNKERKARIKGVTKQVTAGA